MTINYIDIAISIILLFFVYRGFMNGFLHELSAIVGLGVGFFLAKMYAFQLALHLDAYISNSFSYLTAFMLIMMFTVLITGLIARILNSFFKMIFISWLNHSLGMCFGFAKGALFVSFLIYIVTSFSPSHMYLLQESVFLPYYYMVVDCVSSFLTIHYAL